MNCDVLAFVGRVLELKDKSTGATIIVGITGTEELPKTGEKNELIYSIKF